MRSISLRTFLLVLLLFTTVMFPGAGHAQVDELGAFAKERFQLRLRGIGVLPESGGELNVLAGDPKAEDVFVPEIDITYFLTDTLALELIAATSRHDVTQEGPDLDLGATNILPPTLTAQYHFSRDSDFSPYVGAGINYTHPYNEDDGNATGSLEAQGNFGYALQAGTDIWLSRHWGLNFDVKKIFVELDVESTNPATRGDVELDPWIVGAGVAYRF